MLIIIVKIQLPTVRRELINRFFSNRGLILDLLHQIFYGGNGPQSDRHLYGGFAGGEAPDRGYDSEDGASGGAGLSVQMFF